MFALLKKKNLYPEAAEATYARLFSQSRQTVFYTTLGVPDTFIGRFDLLLLHVFFMVHRVSGDGTPGQTFAQELFDVVFSHMDQSMRELGIGDMGVPKRMKKMMKAFNGRMHAYEESLSSDAALEDALKRNLYGSVKSDIDPENLARMREYVRANIDVLSNQSLTDILEGGMVLRDIN